MRVQLLMAGIDVGGAASRRELNRDLPLVPFIDFLLCIVAFLLVTAVWSQMARLEASANVPGNPGPTPPAVRPELHVSLEGSDRISLEWREGSTVLTQEKLPRSPRREDEGTLRYPDLVRRIAASWSERGVHRSPSDPARDRAVVHAGNTAEFEEIVATLDAISGVERELERGSAKVTVPAFEVTFAAN